MNSMAETNVVNGMNHNSQRNSKWTQFRVWLNSVRGTGPGFKDKPEQPQISKIDPNSGLYKFIKHIGAEGFTERGAVEHPLNELYGDFQRSINNLTRDEELRNKITEAFDGGKLGVILKLVYLMSLDHHNDAKKISLVSQLRSYLEPLVITTDRTSQEAAYQREWIEREASWDQLIGGVFKRPDPLDVYDKEMEGKNLDPKLPTQSSTPVLPQRYLSSKTKCTTSGKI